MSKAKQLIESLNFCESSVSMEFNGKNTEKFVAFLKKQGFKCEVNHNGKLEVIVKGKPTTLFKDDVVTISGSNLSITKPSYVSEANSKLPKASFGKAGEFSYAFRVDGVEPEFYNRPFGRQLDSIRKAGEFCKEAKSYHVGCKGKSTMACVKAWVKTENPTQFYAKWKSDSSSYKDDSVEVFYKV